MRLTGRLLGRRRRRGGAPAGGRMPPPRASLVGRPAIDVAGVAPGGAPLGATVSGEWSGRLLFLTSGCLGCRAVWEGLAGVGPAPGRGIVVVTPSPSTESASAVTALAPAGVTVVMSSEGWHAYGVTGAPWVVEVAGGVIVGEGPAGA